MTSLSDGKLDSLANLQVLFVKLLFCQRTLMAYRADPVRTLAGFGLPPEFQGQLPDTNENNFVAEMNGRRRLVRQTVDGHFPRTLDLLGRLAEKSGSNVEELNFDEFLSSDYFFKAANSLPHPNGVGPGYESTSKFYFWFRETYGTARPGVELELRKMLNCDFSNYLMEQFNGRSYEYYKRFTGGIYWPCIPGDLSPVHLVSDQLYFFEIEAPDKIAQMSEIGLTNLDELQPVDWEFEENIF